MESFTVDHDLEELTAHRTVDLPIACYETQITQNIHGLIPLHWHEEIQFAYLLKGEAVFTVNEETPLNYVTDYCIQKATVLLKQSETTVTNVDYQIGFNSTSYFIDKLKTSIGLTPLKFKKDTVAGG